MNMEEVIPKVLEAEAVFRTCAQIPPEKSLELAEAVRSAAVLATCFEIIRANMQMLPPEYQAVVEFVLKMHRDSLQKIQEKHASII